MRFFLFVFLGAFSIAQAQVIEQTHPLSGGVTAHFNTETTDTINPPFVDDFSYRSDRPMQELWSDQYVWINDAVPLFQNSIGVATFDGCNAYGKPYQPGNITTNGISDQLTSNYINLQGATDVWLSFQYQRAGRGEAPSPSDSLVVSYYSPVDSTWTQIWGEKGTGNADAFKTAMIPVTGSQFLKKGFRFRLATYGARGGAYDVWNVDYVQLDKDRNPGDSVVTEPAFARPHPLILGNGPYTSWPWWLSMSNTIANRPNNLTFTYRRLGTVPSGGWSLNLGQYRWEENGILIQQQTAVPVITTTQHDQDLTFDVAVPAGALGTLNGPTKVTTKVWFDGSAAGTRQNDTVQGTLHLDNYLALDDGTAERAYGIENVSGSRVAQKFNTGGLGSNDSLKGISMNFAWFEDSVYTFRMAVWAPADSGSAPGVPLYLTDSVYQHSLHWDRNDIFHFALDSALDISAYPAVWIGYVDVSPVTTMYVGLDQERTLPNTMPRYYGDGFNWYPSLEPGALVLRPFFRYTPTTMAVTAPAIHTFEIYPNPSSQWVSVASKEAGQFEVAIQNLNGQVLLVANGEERIELDITPLPKGMYLIRTLKNGALTYTKWIKI